MTTLVPERLEAVQGIPLGVGSHNAPPKDGQPCGLCVEWQGRRDAAGYGRVGKRNQGAHRLAWERVRGPIPDGLYVLHRCDNPPCVNADHLFLGTYSDNALDRQRKGRTRGFIRSGSDHHAHKVTAEVEARARELRGQGWSQQRIAAAVGISRGHVARVVAGVLPRNTRGRS